VVANAFEQAARQLSYRSMPRITFTTPTIASVGMTQRRRTRRAWTASPAWSILRTFHARSSAACRPAPSSSSPNARRAAFSESPAGRRAGDAILAGVYAIDAGMTVTDLAESWDPYLTIGEGLYLAAQAFTRELSTLSCCAV